MRISYKGVFLNFRLFVYILSRKFLFFVFFSYKGILCKQLNIKVENILKYFIINLQLLIFSFLFQIVSSYVIYYYKVDVMSIWFGKVLLFIFIRIKQYIGKYFCQYRMNSKQKL